MEKSNRKRFACLVGQADESYQRHFLEGFLTQTFGADVDVCVFSMYRKYQDSEIREKGDSNIFNLVNYSIFDGIVFLKDSIQTINVADALEEKIRENYDGPVIVIEGESDVYKCIGTDGYYGMKIVVDHMIEVHGYKEIGFLSGKKWHPHSKQRLQAFRDSMEAHGLEVDEKWIHHGDFWYTSGEQYIDIMLAKNGRLPEAIICACDQMAVGLCDSLVKHGYRIPEDIAVAGYDSTEEGQNSPKSITSALAPARECGEYAANFLLKSEEERNKYEFCAKPGLVVGESCGCKESTIPEISTRREEWSTDISETAYNSVNDTFQENLCNHTTLRGFLDTVYSYAYQIKGAESFNLLLCAPWNYMEDDYEITVGNHGYTEEIIHAIRYNSDNRDGISSLSDIFCVKEILPDIYLPRKKPLVYYFTPLFCGIQCYGYASVAYDNPRSYDDVYRLWVTDVAVGLECLRKELVIRNIQKKMEALFNSKYSITDIRYEMLSNDEKNEYELVNEIIDNNMFRYDFQPIVSAKTGEIFSYEALMRPTTELNISPIKIIKFASMQGRLSEVEYRTFLNVLKIVDENKDVFSKTKMFVNSIPGILVNQEQFEEIDAISRRNANSIVVELTEESELEDQAFNDMKAHFDEIGVEIALDDYGTGYSNVGNLLRYMPNYVKIDRYLLTDIQNYPNKQYFVKETIDFCHDNGIVALAEGVENSDELRTVIHLGADLIQGYYTAKPSSKFIESIDSDVKEEIIHYYNEKQTGSIKKVYESGKTGRVSLRSLISGSFTDILVGDENVVYKDIIIAGAPGLVSNMHLKCKAGYQGRITLENVIFSDQIGKPCMEIGENCDVILVLRGENIMDNTGIYVPESSKLTIEGKGDLCIRVKEELTEGYSSRGTIIYNQSGRMWIERK
ncbi:EAL domain-containing protein [Eubacterium xylanophilum]|uniref:EAL domain-containing protein n=1 Tax=Eubacterium xylanophilum TaxID=39497 RepID=UPI0004B9AF03|nr:EAL domain-containing protein [Eubacterium xylanophilum]